MSAPGSSVSPIASDEQQPEAWLRPDPGSMGDAWQLALESAGDGAWNWNIVADTFSSGPHFKAMLGYADDEFGSSYNDLLDKIHPDDLPRLRGAIAAHFEREDRPFGCDLRVRNRDGEYMWMQMRGRLVARDAEGRPLRMVGTQRDISQARQAETVLQQQLAETVRLNHQLEGAQVQLVQSEKLAAIGQLAAGVAHEMNTPIGFVSSNFTSLERYVGQIFAVLEAYRRAAGDPEECAQAEADYQAADISFLRDDLPALLAETRDGLERVQRIVRDLKDFSRVGEQEWQFTDLHRGLDSTLNILRYEIKHKADVIREYGDLPEVWCVPSMLNQVFLNLLANAIQAIETRGSITVRTGVETGNIVIRVIDTGSGIAPEHIARIFDPFFTTKPAGKGTGLGLSLAQDIVRQHRGRLFASTVHGQGSTFTIELPLSSLSPSATDTGDPS